MNIKIIIEAFVLLLIVIISFIVSIYIAYILIKSIEYESIIKKECFKDTAIIEEIKLIDFDKKIYKVNIVEDSLTTYYVKVENNSCGVLKKLNISYLK